MKTYVRLAYLVLSLLLVGLGIVFCLAKTQPATGYRLSMYDSLSTWQWVVVLSSIIAGIVVIVFGSVFLMPSQLRHAGFALLLLANILVVLLPYLNQMAFSDRGDHLSHFAESGFILKSGTTQESNVYPITHILVSETVLLLGVPLPTVIALVGPFFYVVFIIFSYLLAWQVLPRRAAVLSALAASVVSCYYYKEVFPMGFAFITFPLLYSLYFSYSKQRQVSNAIALLVLIILLPFFHPVSSFMAALGLASAGMGKFCSRGFMGAGHNRPSLVIPSISFIVLLIWIWEKFWVWNSLVRNVYGWFKLELLNRPFVEMAEEALNKLGLSPLGRAELFVRMYGHIFVFIIMSMWVFTRLLKNRKASHLKGHDLLFAYMCFLVLVILVQGVDWLRPLTELTSGRIIWLVTALLPLSVGVAAFWINVGGLVRGYATRLLLVNGIFIFASIVGVFALYPSPLTYRAEPSLSRMELKGAEWLLRNYDTRTGIMAFTADNLIGKRLPQVFGFPARPPRILPVSEHFGYDRVEICGSLLEYDAYLYLNKMDRFYPVLYPQVGRFTQADFDRLDEDPTVAKIYLDGDAEVRYVVARQTLL